MGKGWFRSLTALFTNLSNVDFPVPLRPMKHTFSSGCPALACPSRYVRSSSKALNCWKLGITILAIFMRVKLRICPTADPQGLGRSVTRPQGGKPTVKVPHFTRLHDSTFLVRYSTFLNDEYRTRNMKYKLLGCRVAAVAPVFEVAFEQFVHVAVDLVVGVVDEADERLVVVLFAFQFGHD